MSDASWPYVENMTNTTNDTTAEYQININGAAWSTVRRCALSTEIARVEDMLSNERQRISGISRFDGLIERDAAFGAVHKVRIDIRRWEYNPETRKGTETVVARWLGGERIG